MIPAPAIEAHGLRKSYGRVQAVNGLDLAVARGRITGFLGRNGAGKSTTIKMLLGMIRPSGGSGFVLGRRIDDPRESVELRRQVAYAGEDKRLYGYMTVEQTLRFTRSFFPDWDAGRAARLLRRYELPVNRRVGALSKGMRTKLALLLALARRPELLILDEPSEGLDPVSIEQLLEGLVGSAADGAAVFFSSHQIAEVERVADDVCIIDRGRIVLDASLEEIRGSYRQIEAVFPAPPGEGAFDLAGVESVRASGARWSVLTSDNTEAIVDQARRLSATSIEVAPVGLRELFLEKVKEGLDALV
jgi:ABC-2 type transport system ATP-binding protein